MEYTHSTLNIFVTTNSVNDVNFAGDRLVRGEFRIWSVMHTKRGAIFSSPLGRENVVSDFGVHIIPTTIFSRKAKLRYFAQ